MRIILDTDKKTIIVPWNYTAKLDELNRTIAAFGGEGAKLQSYNGFIDDCWRYAMEHSETNVVAAAKPVKNPK